MKNILIILLLVCPSAKAAVVLTPWETSRKSGKVELQYRWVLVGDTLKTREMRAIFTVRATPEEILVNFYDPEKASRWASGTRECRIYKKSCQEWINYTAFDIPKPLRQQDLVTKYRVIEAANKKIVHIQALPGFLPAYDEYERVQHYSGRWELTSTKGHTRVEFFTVSYTKPMLPRWLQDQILQPMMMESFETLIKLSQNELL